MINHREANQLFEWLHEEGFEIAIDDFGTGHSALIDQRAVAGAKIIDGNFKTFFVQPFE